MGLHWSKVMAKNAKRILKRKLGLDNSSKSKWIAEGAGYLRKNIALGIRMEWLNYNLEAVGTFCEF